MHFALGRKRYFMDPELFLLGQVRLAVYPSPMRHLIAALILIATPALAADYPARVVGVTDGDTLTVLRDGRTQVKVRLSGIDAPETGQDFGSRAKQAASKLAFGKQVTIREVDKDRYGRTVADVVLPDGRSLGREMVAEGMAWDYRTYSNDPTLVQIEAEARNAHLGLWSQPNPLPPWDWRHGKNIPVTDVVIGNRRSHLYHAPHCRAAAIMKPENRVEFKTTVEAEAKGYRKAADCK